MADRQLTHVQQSNRSTGCGPACLAILSGRTEAEAIMAIFGEARTRSLRTEWPQLKHGLAVLGVKFNGPALRTAAWSSIKGLAIVGCGKKKLSNGDEVWHWVVYDPCGEGSGLIYDPARATPHAPTRRTAKPFSYLSIS